MNSYFPHDETYDADFVSGEVFAGGPDLQPRINANARESESGFPISVHSRPFAVEPPHLSASVIEILWTRAQGKSYRSHLSHRSYSYPSR